MSDTPPPPPHHHKDNGNDDNDNDDTYPPPTSQRTRLGLGLGNSGGGTHNNEESTATATATASPSESLTPLEQEVLDEYARLLGNLNNMSTLLSTLSQNPSADILDALRGLERKTSLVFTLLKASVYSIVLEQQFVGDDGHDNHGDNDDTELGLN